MRIDSRSLLIGLMAVGAQFSAAATEFRVLTNGGAAAAGIVLYLEPLDGQPKPNPSAVPMEIHQSGKRFSPYISVVPRGSELNFVNDDDITHHIYSALGPSRFAFKLYADEHRSMRFDNTGAVAMGCNIHDWMSGHLLVLDTPWFAITGNDGRINIDAPPGRYQLQIWHPQLQAPEKVESYPLQLPHVGVVEFKLTHELAPVPPQKGLDDFDYLEGY